MNRQITQFWVAVIGMAGLVAITAMVVAGTVWGKAPSELAYMLVGSLVSSTSMAVAYLFRLNGTSHV